MVNILSKFPAGSLFYPFFLNLPLDPLYFGPGILHLLSLTLTPQPPMSDARKRVIGEAFAKLDKSGDGFVTIDDLTGVYDVKVFALGLFAMAPTLVGPWPWRHTLARSLTH